MQNVLSDNVNSRRKEPVVVELMTEEVSELVNAKRSGALMALYTTSMVMNLDQRCRTQRRWGEF